MQVSVYFPLFQQKIRVGNSWRTHLPLWFRSHQVSKNKNQVFPKNLSENWFFWSRKDHLNEFKSLKCLQSESENSLFFFTQVWFVFKSGPDWLTNNLHFPSKIRQVASIHSFSKSKHLIFFGQNTLQPVDLFTQQGKHLRCDYWPWSDEKGMRQSSQRRAGELTSKITCL